MLKSKKPGLAIVETILVLAISGLMFVVVIGLFSTRKRAQSDDGARQVLSIIAKVRNEAQSGKGPVTQSGKNLLKCNRTSTCEGVTANDTNSANVIFGQAIKFYTKTIQGNTTSYLYIYKLMENQKSGLISAYEMDQIQVPGELLVFAPGGTKASVDPDAEGSTDDSVAPDNCLGFATCYQQTGGSLNPIDKTPLSIASNEYIALVFLNRTGESYAFAMSNPLSPYTNGSYKVTPDANRLSKYTSERQGILRLALIAPGNGNDLITKATNSTARYYINFDLSVPNNQSLEVVK